MKKIIILFLILLIVYPLIEFKNDEYIYMMSYGKDLIDSVDFQNFEDELCYSESYSYNKKRNITITSWEYHGFLFFKWIKARYKDGNECDNEYTLEESYIDNFLNNAIIIEGDDVDLAKLIKDKKAIVGNKKYPWDDNHKWISYKLNDEYEEMFIFIKEDKIIIQVGLSDEGPKYIAYK